MAIFRAFRGERWAFPIACRGVADFAMRRLGVVHPHFRPRFLVACAGLADFLGESFDRLRALEFSILLWAHAIYRFATCAFLAASRCVPTMRQAAFAPTETTWKERRLSPPAPPNLWAKWEREPHFWNILRQD